MLLRQILLSLAIQALFTTGAYAGANVAILNVGIVIPLSGEQSVFGSKMMKGVELARERMAGLPVEFYIEDAGSPTHSTIVSATQKLVTINHIDLMVALVFEDHLFKILPLLKHSNIPVIAAALCSENTRSYPHTACSYPSAREQLLPMFPDALSRNIKSFGFIGEESSFSEGALREFSGLLKEYNFNLAATTIIGNESLDYRSVVTKILAQKPDAVAVCTLDPAKSLMILRQLKEQGFTGVRYGFIDYDKKYFKDFGDAVKGVILPGWIASHYGSDFVRRYSAKWGDAISDIDVYSTLAYDMLSFSTLSALQLKSRDTSLTINDLINYSYSDAAIPHFHYNQDRTVSMPMVIKAIGANGELTEQLPITPN